MWLKKLLKIGQEISEVFKWVDPKGKTLKQSKYKSKKEVKKILKKDKKYFFKFNFVKFKFETQDLL